jgi:hypothetical protein
MRFWKKILLVAGVLVFGVVSYGVISFGPRNIVGMLRYDQRKEGLLHTGDQAPNVTLLALDGKTPFDLKEKVGSKPLVLIFGSFT